MGPVRRNPPREAKSKFYSNIKRSDRPIPEKTRQKLSTSNWSTTKFYPLSIIDKKIDCGINYVKVHYKNWSSKYDEWRVAEDVLTTPEYVCIPDANELFRNSLIISIKEQLNTCRKVDSLVNIKLNIQRDTFDELKSLGTPAARSGRYRLQSLSDLNNYLGDGWYYRIVNSSGDFSFVISGTTQFWLHERKPLISYSNDKTSHTLLHRGFVFTMRFVRDHGTSHDFDNFMHIVH